MMDGRKPFSQKPVGKRNKTPISNEKKKEANRTPRETSAGGDKLCRPKQTAMSLSKPTSAKSPGSSSSKTQKHVTTVTTDAKKLNESREDQEGPRCPRVPRARMSVSAGSMEYNMLHPRRGKAVIFSHEIFDPQTLLPPRTGTKKDVERLETTLTRLEFEIEVNQDMTRWEIGDKIRSLSKEDHSDCDCIMVIVLTHGSVQQLYAKDYSYCPEEIWKPFGADQCPTLAGKPKIFVFQACRGENRDLGVLLEATSKVQIDSIPRESYKIPSMADFLVCNASFEGFVSFRDIEEGSWYIKSLCEILDEHYEKMDLLRMLTRTAHKVAVEYRADTCDNSNYYDCKQAPTLMSTLIRDVCFTNKKNTKRNE